MSAYSVEIPRDLVDPRGIYDPVQIADEVLWPLVTHIWDQGKSRVPWRESADSERDIINTYQKRRYSGRYFRVELSASVQFPCDFLIDDEENVENYDYEDLDKDEEFEAFSDTLVEDDEEDDVYTDEDPIHIATFYLEETVFGERRLAIIDMAKLAMQAEVEAKPEREEDILLNWPEGEEELFRVSTMNTYTLFGDDPWHINRTKIIEGDNMDEFALDFDEADDATTDRKVREADLEALETICAVFNAPKAIMEALGRIKTQPVNFY